MNDLQIRRALIASHSTGHERAVLEYLLAHVDENCVYTVSVPHLAAHLGLPSDDAFMHFMMLENFGEIYRKCTQSDRHSILVVIGEDRDDSVDRLCAENPREWLVKMYGSDIGLAKALGIERWLTITKGIVTDARNRTARCGN